MTGLRVEHDPKLFKAWRKAIRKRQTLLGYDHWCLTQKSDLKLVRYENGEFIFRTDLLPLFLLHAGHMLTSVGAENFVTADMEMEGKDGEGNRIYFTVGRAQGKTPTQEIGELKARIAELEAQAESGPEPGT